LIHPLLVDELQPIAGCRRLEAAKLLGWTRIEVRLFGELSA
jgi:ParB-like chromosome segregation protein Spo0J